MAASKPELSTSHLPPTSKLLELARPAFWISEPRLHLLSLPLDSPPQGTGKLPSLYDLRLSPGKLLPCRRLSHTHLGFPGNVIPTTLLPPE